jgi:zinc transport system permease protein
VRLMLKYDFMQNAFLVSAFIAVLCPCIGVFLVLRRYSMIGDTLSHASLAGIAIALTAGGSPILGAFLFTTACGALIEFLRGYFRKNADLILSVVLALCVGVAVTIISSGRLHVSADAFMFGSILTVTRSDMYMALGLSAVSVVTLITLYHQLVYIAYDEEAAKVAKVRVKLINYVFSVLVAAAVSVSIRIVGVLVLSSMLSLPVAAALQLGRGFRTTLLCSVLFSVVDIMLGLILSYYMNVAPGGLTALISVAVLLIVIILKKAGIIKTL